MKNFLIKKLPIKSLLKQARTLLDSILPQECFCCNTHLKKGVSNLCDLCQKNLYIISSNECRKCQQTFDIALKYNTCSECYFEGIISYAKYEKTAQRLIFRLKFMDDLEVAKFIANSLFNKIKESSLEKHFNIIAPVPLHRFRLISRKYNQSALIAQELANLLRISYIPDLLIKVKFTKDQKKLNFKKRRTNLDQAFIVNQKHLSLIEENNILVVDDVITTETTAKVILHLLRECGAISPTFLAFATTYIK